MIRCQAFHIPIPKWLMKSLVSEPVLSLSFIITDKFLFGFQVCYAFCLAIFNKMYIAFAVCSLLMEVNSVFLHLRQLLYFHGVSKTSLLYQINGLFLLITFVNFRFLTSAWMTNFVIQHRNVLPFWHFLFSAAGMAVVTVLNIELFMKLWRSDFKREQIKQRED